MQRVGVLLLVGLVGCAVRLCYLCALVRPRVPGVSVCDPAPPGVFELDLGPLTVGLKGRSEVPTQRDRPTQSCLSEAQKTSQRTPQ